MKSNEFRESGFIGRQRELAVLAAALDDALAGRGQMVMLSGEPGIGKTRLAQEFASRAQSLGAQVLSGWCYEHAGAPPYWPYVHPIRTYIENSNAETLISQMGLGGAAIAEIIPQLREKLPDLAQPATAEPEQARFRLFDSVATFLKNAAQSQPMVFVVDDLHWADSSSLLMLEYLVKEIAGSPMLVLGTYRDAEITGGHPLSQTLGNLVRERHFRRVQLDGLTQQEVGEFVQGSKGVNLANDILQTIHSRTEGNPLFVNEVVELIDPDQMTVNRAWAEIIPEGVRDAIGSRLGRLSETCNKVLSAASVIGREFDFSLLNTLDTELGADVVLGALDEALEAKVIEDLPAVGRYQFGHALIQQALYDDMSSIRRFRAHASIAESLEQMHQSTLAEHAAELAHHFAEAASVLGTEKLARYSLMAGERSLATYGYEDALTHFQTGLAARDIAEIGTDAASDDETAALLYGLGRAQMATLERDMLSLAVASLTRAFEHYECSGNVSEAVAVASYPVPFISRSLNDMVNQLIPRALALVPPDSIAAGRLLSNYGRILGIDLADYGASRKSFDKALTIAQQENDESLEMLTLANDARVDTYHFRRQESVEKITRASALVARVNNPRISVAVHMYAQASLEAVGDIKRSREHTALGLAAAELLKDQFWLPRFLRMVSVEEHAFGGDWDKARNLSDRSLAISPLDITSLATRAILEAEVGDLDRSGEFQSRMKTSMDLAELRSNENMVVSCMTSAISRITGDHSQLDLAEKAAQAILAALDGATPINNKAALRSLGLVAVTRENETDSKKYYDALVTDTEAYGLWEVAISLERLLGLLAETAGDITGAAAHFESALTRCRNSDRRPELAWTCHDYAEALLQRNDSGDLEKALSLIDESLAVSSDLGMRPLMERAEAVKERLRSGPVSTPAYPDGLTRREVEVLQLICDGMTDREIGEGLFISIKTVGNHVSNILNKTSAANRTEAASYAHTHGLVGPNSKVDE